MRLRTTATVLDRLMQATWSTGPAGVLTSLRVPNTSLRASFYAVPAEFRPDLQEPGRARPVIRNAREPARTGDEFLKALRSVAGGWVSKRMDDAARWLGCADKLGLDKSTQASSDYTIDAKASYSAFASRPLLARSHAAVGEVMPWSRVRCTG